MKLPYIEFPGISSEGISPFPDESNLILYWILLLVLEAIQNLIEGFCQLVHFSFAGPWPQLNVHECVSLVLHRSGSRS
jgi:hypothetical protein